MMHDTASLGAPARPAWVAPLGLLIATGSLIGLSTNLAKLAADTGLAALPFLAWSVAGATVALLMAGTARRRRPRLDRRTLEYFVVAAIFSVAAPNLILFAAAPHVGAGFVALAIAFPPLYTYLGALGLGMERFDGRRATGVVLALAGAALIAALKLSAPDAPVVWIAATLAAPVLLAVGNIYRTLRWPTGARPEDLAPGMLGAAAGILVLAGLLPGANLAIPLDGPMPLLLVLTQAAAFAVQYLLFFRLQELGGPVLLSLLGSVAAVVGVPLAMVLLAEKAPDGLLPAAVLIGSGTTLVVLNGARARR